MVDHDPRSGLICPICGGFLAHTITTYTSKCEILTGDYCEDCSSAFKIKENKLHIIYPVF